MPHLSSPREGLVIKNSQKKSHAESLVSTWIMGFFRLSGSQMGSGNQNPIKRLLPSCPALTTTALRQL